MAFIRTPISTVLSLGVVMGAALDDYSPRPLIAVLNPFTAMVSLENDQPKCKI